MKIKIHQRDVLSFAFLSIFVVSIFLVTLGSNLAAADGSRIDDAMGFKNQWRREGQFFNLVISKSNPIRIFVEGKEQVKIDLSKFKITVRMMNPHTYTLDAS